MERNPKRVKRQSKVEKNAASNSKMDLCSGQIPAGICKCGKMDAAPY